LKLVRPYNSSHNKIMKNKKEVTNRTVTELTNKLLEVQRAKGNKDHAYAYTLGTIQAILDWEVKGYYKGTRTLQEVINDSYDSAVKELEEATKKTTKRVRTLPFSSGMEDEFLANSGSWR